MTLPAFQAAELGQSMWYDNISRDLLQSGEVQRLVDEQGVRGITSNPSIFQKAMSESESYGPEFKRLATAGKTAYEIYETLAIEDIQAGADILRPLYDETEGGDGYVSLEVDPTLAHETQRTIDEAERLWTLVDRPNLMVKIPATPEGIPAIRRAISEGINVNVTLIFSREAYADVMDAYMSGLEDRQARGLSIGKVASVASFFVSRLDGAIDKLLDHRAECDPTKDAELGTYHGKAAIANAKLAYELFEETFGTERWAKLAEAGAKRQRPLWASTSTKNPSYPDTLYVDNLIGPDTVNTLPPKTLTAFNDHGTAAVTVRDDLAGAREHMQHLVSQNISLEAVCKELLSAGVEAFAHSFEMLLEAVEERRKASTSATSA